MIKAIILKKINDDINLLECNGKYQAAKILHKKFIREAQSLTPKRDTGLYGPYKKVFDKYFNLASTTPSQNLITTIRSDGFLLKEDQDQLINYVNERLKSLTPTPTATPARVNTPASQTVTADEPTYKYNPNLYITPNPFEDRTVSLNTQEAELAKLQKMSPSNVQPQMAIADPSQNIYQELMGNAKYYLSISDFNNAAIIREQAANSNMTQKEKNAWQQEYANLIHNYSGMADTSQYNIEEEAEKTIYKAADNLGIEIVNPQTIRNNEDKIRKELIRMNVQNRETYRLLRQISLSGFYSV